MAINQSTHQRNIDKLLCTDCRLCFTQEHLDQGSRVTKKTTENRKAANLTLQCLKRNIAPLEVSRTNDKLYQRFFVFVRRGLFKMFFVPWTVSIYAALCEFINKWMLIKSDEAIIIHEYLEKKSVNWYYFSLESNSNCHIVFYYCSMHWPFIIVYRNTKQHLKCIKCFIIFL